MSCLEPLSARTLVTSLAVVIVVVVVAVVVVVVVVVVVLKVKHAGDELAVTL